MERQKVHWTARLSLAVAIAAIAMIGDSVTFYVHIKPI